MVRQNVADSKSKSKQEHDYFKLIKSGLEGFVPFSEMEDVKIVPTLITSYNRATGRGGHPLGRLMVIHGPPQVGKTVLGLSIIESLARAGFPAFVEDAEFANEKRWYNHVCHSPNIENKEVADLDTVEEDIRQILKNVAELKKDKKMPVGIGAVVMVDTLTKLLPRNILEQIAKEGIDKMYPIQALHVSIWLKEVIPQLSRTDSTLIIMLQEREKVDKKGAFDKSYKVTLGTAIQYDNCLRVRVTGIDKIKINKDQVVGLQCFYVVENNKIDGTTYASGSIFTSNGSGDCPLGLDLVMEAAEEAKVRGMIFKKDGDFLVRLDDEKIPIGKNWPEVCRTIRKDDRLFNQLVSSLNESAAREVMESTEKREIEDG